MTQPRDLSALTTRRTPVTMAPTSPVQSRRARQSSRVVEVWRAGDLGVHDEAGEWVTVCVEHGSSCHHETRALAVSWAAEPLTWCEPCQDVTR